MRSAETYAHEAMAYTGHHAEMADLIRAIQADAQNSTDSKAVPVPCGKHQRPRTWVQRCDACDVEFSEGVKADALEEACSVVATLNANGINGSMQICQQIRALAKPKSEEDREFHHQAMTDIPALIATVRLTKRKP